MFFLKNVYIYRILLTHYNIFITFALEIKQ